MYVSSVIRCHLLSCEDSQLGQYRVLALSSHNLLIFHRIKTREFLVLNSKFNHKYKILKTFLSQMDMKRCRRTPLYWLSVTVSIGLIKVFSVIYAALGGNR